jgi:hypothetical protein
VAAAGDSRYGKACEMKAKYAVQAQPGTEEGDVPGCDRVSSIRLNLSDSSGGATFIRNDPAAGRVVV